ncbi:hypothetical protein MASR1M60_15410 [Rhodocyclaceae bacterium]
MYETYFMQRSPMDRAKLAQIIKGIARHQPSTLVIDIDLSPSPSSDDADAQAALDKSLMHLASVSKTLVIIGTPLPSATETMIERKHHWMVQLCNAGIQFGHTHLPISQGLTMRYFVGGNSIAELAARVQPQLVEHGTHPPSTPCELAQEGLHKTAFLSRDFPFDRSLRPDRFRSQSPISANTITHINSSQLILDDISQIDKLGNLSGRTIYLGGGNNDADQFTTVAGPVSGLVLHAAGQAAIETPASNISHRIAFLLDLLLGTAAGFLFGFTWTRYNRHAVALARLPSWSWQAYAMTRLWLVAGFFMLGLFMWCVFAWSGWLLDQNLWNNPGPMLLGVFIKTIIASRIDLFAKQHGLATQNHRIGLTDMALFLPLVILTLYWLFFSAH